MTITFLIQEAIMTLSHPQEGWLMIFSKALIFFSLSFRNAPQRFYWSSSKYQSASPFFLFLTWRPTDRSTVFQFSPPNLTQQVQLYQYIIPQQQMNIIIILAVFRIVELKQLFITYSTERESVEIFKYLHSADRDFYVDIGAYDPIYASNTIGLSGWNGINVQASIKRHRNFMISRPNQINLNIAITNVTGGYTTLVEFSQDSSASINQHFIKINGNPSVTPTQQRVQQMTLADLCQNYYPSRPKFMTVDIEGHGFIALKSNDWSQSKCRPQIILVEHIQDEQQNKKQKNLLLQNGYSFQKNSQLNQFYIDKALLQVYRQRYKDGQKKFTNMRERYWFPLYQKLFQLIIPNFNTDFENFRHVDPKQSPIYLHFASQHLISISKIHKKGVGLSNSTRPILIIHYNPNKSKLLFGSNDYTVKQIKMEQQTVRKIDISYEGQKISVYVLDHQVQSPSPLVIIDSPKNKCSNKQI